MRRWHEERELMLRRWRQEIAKHEAWGDEGYSYCALAPVPPQNDGDCHCYRGMGMLRKTRPWDCGKPHCTICHLDKYYYSKNRANIKRKAIETDLASE